MAKPITPKEMRAWIKKTWDICQQEAWQEQEPVSGKGKEFSEQLKLCARNVAFAASGHVDMSSAAMQEMFALIDHVCTGIDSPPALAQPEQEPVAWVNSDQEVFFDEGKARCYSMGWIKPLYTAPPKREWVGLTEAEILELAGGGITRDERMIAYAIAAKLKEKNNGQEANPKTN